METLGIIQHVNSLIHFHQRIIDYLQLTGYLSFTSKDPNQAE
jgi:hypothetical protein